MGGETEQGFALQNFLYGYMSFRIPIYRVRNLLNRMKMKEKLLEKK